jgi:predicted dehydrogenase
VGIRILHVGLGVRGQHWLDIVQDYPDATSVGCVDPVPATIEKVARRYPELPCFSTLTEALQEVAAEAAIIASPVSRHVENALQCLATGLAVMVEKPFASSVEEALRVVRYGEAMGRPTIVAQNYRFNPAERTLRHLIRQEYVGKVTHVQCHARRHRIGQGTFLRTLDYAQLLDDSVHHFDSLRSILGCNPVSVVARSFNPPWSDYRHGACTEAMLEMEGDIHLQYLGSFASHRYGVSLWIEGEKGVLWSNRKRVFCRQRGKRLFWPMKLVQVPRGDEAPYPREGTTSLLNALRDTLLQQHTPETSGRDNLWTLAMVEAGMRSDREKREVCIAEVLREAEGRATSNV